MSLSRKIAALSATVCLASGIIAPSVANAQPISQLDASDTTATAVAAQADFWFKAADGTRTFNIENNSLVANLVDGDRLEIVGKNIIVYNSSGLIAASLVANLPAGAYLKYQDGKITAHQYDSPFRAYKCINNKWVSFGLGTTADLLVCVPLGVATVVGGIACGIGAGLGLTLLNC